MIQITKLQKQELDAVGLLKYRKTGMNPQDPNFVVINKEHVGRNKHYYVTETTEILAYLERYERLNLQKIRPNQLKQLIKEGLVNEELNVQHPGEYKPAATVWIDSQGQIRCKKIAAYLLAVGIWKQNRK